MQDVEVEDGFEVTELCGLHARGTEVDAEFEGGLDTVESRNWCAGAVELDADNEGETKGDSVVSVRMRSMKT